MLLSNNMEKVVKLVKDVDFLKGVDKVRLAIHILEDLGFKTDYNINSFILLLKEVLEQFIIK